MNEETTITTYEPPVLIELGEFSEDTLGIGIFGGDFAERFGMGS